MISTVIIGAQNQERDKISALLSAENDIKIMARGKDGYDALKLTGSLKPDVVIVDNHLEFIEGGEIPPLLKVRSPSTLVLILAEKISDYQLYRAASNKVSGFVSKETDLDILPEALKCVCHGGCFISPALAARILHLLSLMNEKALDFPAYHAAAKNKRTLKQISPFNDPAGYLSKTELTILTRLSEGLPSDEIAVRLDLAVGTVRNNISSLMNKLGLKSRTQLVCYAFNHGLVPP